MLPEPRAAARRTAIAWKPRSRRGPRTAIGLLVVAIAAAATWWLAERGRGGDRPAYRTEPVATTDLVVKVSAPGSLDVADPVPVPAPLAGIVERLAVDEEARVEAGQLLATIDAGSLGADAARAVAETRAAAAQLSEAEAARDAVEVALARAGRLQASGLSSDEAIERLDGEVRRARAAASAAAAALDASRAGARGARARVARAEVRAPAAGIILRRDAIAGSAVRPDGPPLFVIAPRLDLLRLTAELDEADVGAVAPGATATFTVPAWPGRSFAARLVRVRTAPTRGAAGTSYSAILEADNPDGLLRPGMSAAVTLIVAERPAALTVPEAALRFSPDGAGGGRGRVYLLGGGAGQGGLRPVPVRPGLSDGGRTEIAVPGGGEGTALRPGDRVVVGIATGARGGNLVGGGAGP